MKKILFCSLLTLAASRLLAGFDTIGNYTAHEWGTFTSVQGSDGVVLRWNSAAISQLPDFVYARNHPLNDPALDEAAIMLGTKFDGLWLQRMETPVIYFYADQKQSVNVQVNFPQGQVTEWYPQVSGFGPAWELKNIQPEATNSFVRWSQITLLPPDKNSPLPPKLAGDSKGNHYFTARETAAGLVRTSGGIGPHPRAEAEKFLFYRGVGNFSTPLSVGIDATGRKAIVDNSGGEELRHLYLLQVTKGGAAFTSIDSLPSRNSRQIPLPLAAGLKTIGETSKAITQEMAASLEKEGLFPDEAAAMVKTWRDSWFEEEGARVLYLLPRAWTDQTLPLTLEPKPAHLVRVMVGRAEIFTPRVEEQLATEFSNFENPGTQAEAVAKLRQLKLGRFLEPGMAWLTALLSPHSKPSQELLDRVNAFARATEDRTLARK